MFNIEITIQNPINFESHKEVVKMYSRWAARMWARDVIKCVDVEHIEIIDTETGELILILNDDGSVVWDTEG